MIETSRKRVDENFEEGERWMTSSIFIVHDDSILNPAEATHTHAEGKIVTYNGMHFLRVAVSRIRQSSLRCGSKRGIISGFYRTTRTFFSDRRSFQDLKRNPLWYIYSGSSVV